MQVTTKQPVTVAVVEDERHIAEVVATALEGEGYRVETAADGDDALRLLERRPPDVIVLDLLLPTVDGRQVIKRCRADPATSAIPIIVVSAAADALEDGDVRSLVFVEKPFDLDVLLVLVEDAVSSPAVRASAVA